MNEIRRPICGYEEKGGICQRSAVYSLSFPKFSGPDLYCGAHRPTEAEVQEMEGVSIERL